MPNGEYGLRPMLKEEGGERELSPKEQTEHELAWAEKWAGKGEGILMEYSLDKARGFAQEAGIELDAKRIGKIENEGYSRAARANLARAELCARDGDAELMKFGLGMAVEFAQKAGIELDAKRIKQIEKEGHLNAVEASLTNAETYAYKGEDLSVGLALQEAEKYAREAGIKLDADRVREIKEILLEVKGKGVK